MGYLFNVTFENQGLSLRRNALIILKLLFYWTYYSLLQGNGSKVYQGYQNTWLHKSRSQHSTSCASHLWIQLTANYVDCIYWKKKRLGSSPCCSSVNSNHIQKFPSLLIAKFLSPICSFLIFDSPSPLFWGISS